jgi:hypothetical protein
MRTPIFCVVACLSASVVLAQGLGDAARKEQEKRKKVAESGDKAKAAPAYGNAELLEAPKGKGTFSANVADTSGDSESEAPVPAETGSMRAGNLAATRSDVQPAAEGTEQSDMDRFKEKLAHWRAAVKPLKAQVDERERAVADLEEQAKRPSVSGITSGEPIRDAYGGIVGYRGAGPHRVSSDPEAARLRLPHAREELARAKEALAQVERQAGRDGIAPGQLY